MVNKIFGYLLFAVGAIGVALSFAPVRIIIGLNSLPAGITDLYILLGGAALLILGAFIGFSGSGKQEAEVPIYKGKEIVGYRRMK